MHVHVDDEAIQALHEILDGDDVSPDVSAEAGAPKVPPDSAAEEADACYVLDSAGLTGPPDMQHMVFSCREKPDDPRMECSAELPADGGPAEWVCRLLLEDLWPDEHEQLGFDA